MKTATCHPTERHYCKGLCKNCYQRMMHKQRAPYLERFAKRGRHFGDAPTCHPERPHEAQGLCAACYNRKRLRENPEKARQWNRSWKTRNRERWKAVVRRANLKYKFGISVERYDQLLADQNGVCALCGRPERMLAKRLAVDHDHVTGNVRGLLCGPCNVVVGYLENPDWLGKATAYIKHHKQSDAA